MNLSMKVLLLEDEVGISSFIYIQLTRQFYDVVIAKTVKEAMDIYDHTYTMLLVDLMLPDGSGIEFIKHVRISNARIPIIVLTALTEDDDVVEGFKAGCDDYVKKPFGIGELMVRMKRYQNNSEQSQDVIIREPFTLDLCNRAVRKDGVNIILTPTEFKLFQLIFINYEKTFTKNQIADLIWGKDYVGDLQIVNVNMNRLRYKIDCNKEAYIKTVWGVGYRWEN